MNIGIALAFGALLAWGCGDFLIEKATRKLGDSLSLFYITAFGNIVLLPFVWRDIPNLVNPSMRGEVGVLLGAGCVALIASLFEFEALRVGKIAVIEPIYALEILITLALGGFILHEWLTPGQSLLVLGLVAGIALISMRSISHFKNVRWEKGITYAFFAVTFMGAENFLTGYGSRLTNPLLATWVIDGVITLVMLVYIVGTGRVAHMVQKAKNNPGLVFWVSLIDNAAWILFAYSVLYIPIGLATAISEAYIALAALLGLYINREKLKLHQFSGLAVAVTAAILLSYLGNS
jgi:drug/metabolite transporter (DMT)-like permease